MSTLFHVGPDGPGKCSATVGKCPFGGKTGGENHYTSQEAAQSAFDQEMATQAHVKLSKSKKVTDTVHDARNLIAEAIMRTPAKMIAYEDYMNISHTTWGDVLKELEADEELREYIGIDNAWNAHRIRLASSRRELREIDDEIARFEKQEFKISQRIVENDIQIGSPLRDSNSYYRILSEDLVNAKLLLMRNGNKNGQQRADQLEEQYKKYLAKKKRYEDRLKKAETNNPAVFAKWNLLNNQKKRLEIFLNAPSPQSDSINDYLKTREKAGKTPKDYHSLRSDLQTYRIAEAAHRLTSPERNVDGVKLKAGEAIVRGLYTNEGKFLGVIKHNMQGPNRGFSAVKGDGTRTKFSMPTSNDDTVKYAKLKEQGFIIGAAVSPVNLQSSSVVAPTLKSKLFTSKPPRGVKNFDQGPLGWANTSRSASPKF